MSAAADPRSYDYSSPTRVCDVVMKGGITSGVVYPHAICELAQVYRFKNIGGTSAGAIAAAAAAAAEHGRDAGGFAKLAALPEWVGSGTHLFDLFQPQPATRALFRTFTAGLRARGAAKWGRVLAAALRSFPLAPLLGAAPGIALVVLALLAHGSGWLRAGAVVAGVVLAVLGGALALVLRIVLAAPARITANGFGLCSGMTAGPGSAPALTPWLAGVIDDLAGKTGGDPLTFGELRSQGLELAMVTTNLTQRRPHRLPWPDRLFFFDPDEWRRLFPERVVQWLEDHPPPAGGESSARIREAMLPRLPLPAEDDLPVVVAARMSLSFPLLISAVPLWAFDRTLKRNNDALGAEPPPGARPEPEQCWFSDGGISSNFPVHFFDSALPTHPTFAIDLDHFHPDHPKSADEAENVYLPSSNVGGLLESWNRFPAQPGLGRLVGFVSGLVRTMQNRVDTGLARQPGYRDRIVHVHADATEGGMNLTMPQQVIDALTRRGQEAARLLVERFAETPGTAGGMSWDSHRWVRYRASAAALGTLIEEMAQAWTQPPAPGERSYEELLRRGDDVGPDAYRLEREAQRQLAFELSTRLVAAGEALAASAERLEDGAPRPLAAARIVPRE